MKRRSLFKIDAAKSQKLIQEFLKKHSLLEDSKREHLPDKIIEHATKHRNEIRSKAAENGFLFKFHCLNKKCIAGIFWPSRAKGGHSADAICALAALFIHALGETELNHPLDLLDRATDDATRMEFGLQVGQIQADAAQELVLEQPVDIGFDFQIEPLLEEKEFAWVAKYQHKLYLDDRVPLEKYREWHAANPSGFFIFKLNGIIIGHLTLIPFNEERWAPYRKGEIRETDLGADDIWGIHQTDQMTLLYVESYIVAGEHSRLATPTILMSFLDLASEVMPLSSDTKIYAMNATDKGTNSITRLEFKVHEEEGARTPRLDEHKMYVTTVGDLEPRLKARSVKRPREDLKQVAEAGKAVTASHASNPRKVQLYGSLNDLEAAIRRKDSAVVEKFVPKINTELKREGIKFTLNISS